MDAVVAGAAVSAASGLLGAAIGGTLAYRGAVRGAREVRVAEHNQWKRDHRESAYVDFLTQRNRYVGEMNEKAKAMQEAVGAGTAAEFDFAPWDAVFAARLAELNEAMAIIELFGSRAASAAAGAWLDELPTIYLMATRAGGSFGGNMAAVVEDEVKRYRDPFVDLVRAELGIAD